MPKNISTTECGEREKRVASKGARHTLRAHTHEHTRLFFFFYNIFYRRHNFSFLKAAATAAVLFTRWGVTRYYYTRAAAVVWVDELTARAGAYIYSDDDIGVGEADTHSHTRERGNDHYSRRSSGESSSVRRRRDDDDDVIGALQMEGIAYIYGGSPRCSLFCMSPPPPPRHLWHTYSTRYLAPVHHPPS